MRNSMLAWLVLASVCTLSCDKNGDVVRELESISDRLCKCLSEDCAKAVMAEFDKLTTTVRNFEPSAAETTRVSESMGRFTKCASEFPRLRGPEVEPSVAEVEMKGPMCGAKPCLPVPNGIKRLAFGMTPSEAAAALGLAESSVVADSPRRVAPSTAPDDPIERLINPNYDPRRHAQPLPGTSATVETTVGKRPAECALDFDTSKRLAGIYCSIPWKDEHDVDKRFFEGLLAQLAGKYGPPTSKRDDTSEWRSVTAVLVCSRDHHSAGLSSFTSAHGKLVAKTTTRADLAMKQALEAVESAARREAEAKEAELQDELRALDLDTSSAAEMQRGELDESDEATFIEAAAARAPRAMPDESLPSAHETKTGSERLGR